MKKIKIYRYKWQPIVGIITCFAIMASYAFGMYHAGSRFNNGIMSTMIIAPYIAFCIVAFFIRKPKLIITDYSVMVNTYVPWEVFFEEVDSFYPTSYKGQEIIGIRYKKDVETGLTIEEVEEGLSARKQTLLNPGEPYDIYVTGLSKKPQEILDLLNKRIKK